MSRTIDRLRKSFQIVLQSLVGGREQTSNDVLAALSVHAAKKTNCTVQISETSQVVKQSRIQSVHAQSQLQKKHFRGSWLETNVVENKELEAHGGNPRGKVSASASKRSCIWIAAYARTMSGTLRQFLSIEREKSFILHEPCQLPEQFSGVPLVGSKGSDAAWRVQCITDMIDCNFSRVRTFHKNVFVSKPNVSCELASSAIIKTISIHDLRNTVLPLLEANFNLRVVYIVRDPRAIWKSQQKAFRKKTVDQTWVLKQCRQMNANKLVFHKRLHTVFFDDMVSAPLTYLAALSERLGLHFGRNHEKWIQMAFNNRNCKEQTYSNCRVNSGLGKFKWQASISTEELQMFHKNSDCRAVFQYYNWTSHFSDQLLGFDNIAKYFVDIRARLRMITAFLRHFVSGPQIDLTHNIKVLPSPPSPDVAKATIREMARFTWLNYRHLAFGHDEITPDDGKPRDNWGLHAVTLVDALSTLWIMDLKFEFREGVDFFGAIFSRLMSSRSGLRSLFELNIRLLGGLLGAHSLCFDKDPSYATKLLGYATEVGTRFLPAFRERVLPCEMIEISSGKIACRDSGIVLAQMGSFSLEFRYLSYHSGNPIFKELADRTMEAIMMANDRGLVSNRLSLSNRTAPLFLQRVVEQGQRWSLGANGDSYYEQVNGVIKCDVRFCTYVITVFICISRGLCFQVSAEDVSVVLSTIRGRDVFA